MSVKHTTVLIKAQKCPKSQKKKKLNFEKIINERLSISLIANR
jgi:hypothetical protein